MVTVEDQIDLGGGYYVLRIGWPELAREIQPGQFVMIGLPDLTEMLIRRPFSVARVCPDQDPDPTSFELLYKVVGRATHTFSRLRRGSEMTVLGPLGRGFWLPDDGDVELLLVAGGIGNAPFPLLVQRLGEKARKTTLFFGGRTRGDLTLLDWFEQRCHVVVATEDGSLGARGRVTEPLVSHLDGSRNRPRLVLACGPHPMLRAVAAACLERDVPCQLAVEETMACGFGVCLGCVVPKRHPTSEFDRFVRVCREGPVFDAREIVL
ncbi:MAG: dihydroorotate dehydrogenase electron transfer subunit [Acidobacteriota bacterium]|nr:dihydroorotate dehydrogenase electron transfer subunit [Acidobacteriota bacterium]